MEVPMVCWSADSCVFHVRCACFLERNIDEILKVVN